MDAADGFEQMYRATGRSRVYLEAVRASASDLPEWLVPYSFVGIPLLERFATELSVRADQTVLDIGCGAGGPTLWIAEQTGASVVGVDFSPAAIEAATALAARRELPGRARFRVSDATATGVADASADAVMSIDALMFVDADSAAREIARALKPGGRLVMTSPESLVESFFPTLVRDYRPIFERAGLTTICHEEPPGHADRQSAFYQALVERSDRLRAEMGEPAESLLNEARNGLAPEERGKSRVRQVLYVAERLAP